MGKQNKGSKSVTVLFYLCYFLLITAFGVGVLYQYTWLNRQLITFEAAAQPDVKCEEVFQQHFANPDWAALYDASGHSDTAFEGKDAFVTSMTDWVGSDTLSYEKDTFLEDLRVYRILLRGEPIGSFTLANQAKSHSLIPDWELDSVFIQPNRDHRITVVLLDGHTAYVNGQPLDDSYTVEIRSTIAEDYLPAGTRGVRMLRQEVTGLMLPPEVTVQDADGTEYPLNYSEETSTYTEILPQAEPIPDTLAHRAIAAGEAYCSFLANRGTGLLSSYFAPGSQAYREITKLPRWAEDQPLLVFFDQKLSEYTRYTEDLFSVRVSMTVEMKSRYDPDPTDGVVYYLLKTEEQTMDRIFFFENRKDGWMVTGMSNEDITQPTSRVRLTFRYGDAILSSAFYDSNGSEIYAPLIATQSGQVLTGWTGEDGTTYACDAAGKLDIPADTVLKPMTLSPVFVQPNSESEETP